MANIYSVLWFSFHMSVVSWAMVVTFLFMKALILGILVFIMIFGIISGSKDDDDI